MANFKPHQESPQVQAVQKLQRKKAVVIDVAIREWHLYLYREETKAFFCTWV